MLGKMNYKYHFVFFTNTVFTAAALLCNFCVTVISFPQKGIIYEFGNYKIER
jgi:hypothetical protein